MKILNLANKDISQLKYKVIKFPDGQQDVVIEEIPFLSNVAIISRFNSFQDLELIICAKKSLDRLFTSKVYLFIPYLLGARSDRKFVHGGNSYLVDVIAPILNSLDFHFISSIDTHSDVAAACIKRFASEQHIFNAYSEIKKHSELLKTLTAISPDAGATKRTLKQAKAWGLTKIVECSKQRDVATGEILSVNVPEDLTGQSCLIIDDICDGGRTFIELAKALKNKGADKLYLFVTHGIFSKGLESLMEHFELVFTTDSIREYSPESEFVIRNEKYISRLIIDEVCN